MSLRLLAGYCCAHATQFYTLIQPLYNIKEIRLEASRSILHFIQQRKCNVFTGVYILWSYLYPKRTGFIASYLEITCVYQILLDNRDLQSCQIGQGKDVAITTPTRSILCTLSHQAVPTLVNGLDSMWHISTRGSDQRTILWFLFWVQIARRCIQRSTWNVLPRVTTSWGLNTLDLNIISKLFDQTTSQMKLQFFRAGTVN